MPHSDKSSVRLQVNQEGKSLVLEPFDVMGIELVSQGQRTDDDPRRRPFSRLASVSSIIRGL